MKVYKHIIFIIVAILGCVLILFTHKDARTISFTSAELMTSDDPTYLYTPGMLLSEGNYTVTIEYSANSDCRIDIYGDYNANYIETLSASEHQFVKDFSLTDDAQGSKIRFTLPPDGGSLQIDSITILANKPIYNDAIYLTIIYLLFLFCIWLMLYKKVYAKWTHEQLLIYAGLVGLIIITSIPQLRTTLIDGIDLGGQIIRLEGVKDALLEHQFPAILYPRTANEYGELGFIYPHLFLYPLALLRMMNISISTVYSTACVLSNIISIVLTYIAVKSIMKSNYSALLSVILFAFFPARLATFTHDGSLFGSGFAAMFLALTIAGIYQILFDDTKKWWFLTVGLTGIFQSHLVTTLIMIFITALIFICFLKKTLYKERLFALGKAAVVFILVNLWYMIPFIYYYATEALGLSALGDTFFTYSFTELISNTNFLLSAFLLLCGFYYLIRFRAEKDSYYPFLAVLTVIDCILMLALTSILPWEWLRSFSVIHFLTSTLQFASRLYIMTELIGAFLFAAAASKWVHTSRGKSIFILATTLLMISISAQSVYSYMTSSQVLLTQKIGYLQPYIQREYLPPDTENEFFAGNSCTLSDESGIYAENYLKHGSRLIFSYSTALTDAYVEVPMFCYNDYVARSDDGTPIALSSGTHHKLRIALPPTETLRTVTVSFEASPLYKLFVIISLLSTICCIYLVRKHKI